MNETYFVKSSIVAALGRGWSSGGDSRGYSAGIFTKS